jgi:ankyrin repeat protein
MRCIIIIIFVAGTARGIAQQGHLLLSRRGVMTTTAASLATTLLQPEVSGAFPASSASSSSSDVAGTTKNKLEMELLEAYRLGDADAVSRLVRAGASFDVLSAVFGFYPLHEAAKIGSERTAKFFVEEGAGLDTTMKTGTDKYADDVTPLYLACDNGNLGVARVLINGGCDVNKGVTTSAYKKRRPSLLCAVTTATASTPPR